MNTTSHRLVGMLSLIAGLSPAIALAAPATGLLQVCIAAAAVGESGDTQQCDDLLRQARKALADGHLQLADSCISRAEQLNPKYSIFHMGDTPVKARTDLNKRLGIRTTAEDRSETRAGTAKDPFLARHQPEQSASEPATTSPNSDAPGLTRLPPVDETAGQPIRKLAGPGTVYPSTTSPPLQLSGREMAGAEPITGNAKTESDTLLRGARRRSRWAICNERRCSRRRPSDCNCNMGRRTTALRGSTP